MAILTSDKIDFQSELVTRDRGHYMVQGSIHQGNITIVNMCAPNIGAPKYLRQILIELNGEIDVNTVIIRDLNTPL